MNLNSSQNEVVFNTLDPVSLGFSKFAVVVLNLAFYPLANKIDRRVCVYWFAEQPGSLKLPMRVCQPAVLESCPASV
jgi:hypothetical protein